MSKYRKFRCAKEAESWAKVNFGDVYGKKLSDGADFEVLFLYSGYGYRFYNSTLRFGTEWTSAEEQELERLKYILANHNLPEKVIAYRYTQQDVLLHLCGSDKLRPGMRFSDKAFLSTSLVKASLRKFKKENPCNCLLKLRLPEGLNAVYISLESTDSRLREQELLLDRNILFEIEKIHRFRYPLLIECKAIPNTSLEEEV